MLFPTKDTDKICKSASFDPSTTEGIYNWVFIQLYDDRFKKQELEHETTYSFADFKFELSEESLLGQAIRSMYNLVISQPEGGYCLSPVTQLCTTENIALAQFATSYYSLNPLSVYSGNVADTINEMLGEKIGFSFEFQAFVN